MLSVSAISRFGGALHDQGEDLDLARAEPEAVVGVEQRAPRPAPLHHHRITDRVRAVHARDADAKGRVPGPHVEVIQPFADDSPRG